MENYFFLESYVTSERAVSHNPFIKYISKEHTTVLKWEIILEITNSGYGIYFDLFGWAEVGQILRPLMAAMGILVEWL